MSARWATRDHFADPVRRSTQVLPCWLCMEIIVLSGVFTFLAYTLVTNSGPIDVDSDPPLSASLSLTPSLPLVPTPTLSMKVGTTYWGLYTPQQSMRVPLLLTNLSFMIIAPLLTPPPPFAPPPPL